MTSIAQYLHDNLDTRFSWGENDCVIFAMRWILLSTGVDHLEPLPKWSTEKEAYRVIQSVGGLVEAMDQRFKRINPNFAVDGDLAFRGGNLMIFTGSKLAGLTHDGLAHVSRLEAECAWSQKS